jgi:hypothetical protein
MIEILKEPFIAMSIIAIVLFSLVLAGVSISDAISHKSLDN